MIPSLIRHSTTILTLVSCCAIAWSSPTHHQLEVRLDPESHRIDVTDTILPGSDVHIDADGTYHMVLHAGLAPEIVSPGWRLEPVEGPVEADFFGINATTDTVAENVPLEAWRLRRARGQRRPGCHPLRRQDPPRSPDPG